MLRFPEDAHDIQNVSGDERIFAVKADDGVLIQITPAEIIAFLKLHTINGQSLFGTGDITVDGAGAELPADFFVDEKINENLLPVFDLFPLIKKALDPAFFKVGANGLIQPVNSIETPVDPPVTPTDPGEDPDTGLPVTEFAYENNQSHDSQGNVIRTNEDGGSSKLVFEIPAGKSGYVRHKLVLPFTLTTFSAPESATGLLISAPAIDPAYGNNDATAAVHVLDNGKVFGQVNGGDIAESTAGLVSDGSWIGIRVDASAVHIEYSNDGGASFVTFLKTDRPDGPQRFKVSTVGNRYQFHHLSYKLID